MTKPRKGKANEPLPVPVEPLPLPPAPSEAEQALIAEATARKANRPSPVRIAARKQPPNVMEIRPNHTDGKGWGARVLDTFGTASESFASAQIQHLLGVVKVGEDPQAHAEAGNNLIAAVAGVQARDETEAMLAVQMAATHQLAMTLLARLPGAQHAPQLEANGNMAVKLLRTFTAQTEALAKLRRGGNQTVRVEHVHAGGQAIVGNVAPSGGGGGTGRTDGQAHATVHEIKQPGAPAPSDCVPLWSPDARRDALPVARGEGQGPMPDAWRRKG